MAKAPKQSPAQPAAESASVPSAKTAAEPTAEQILIANLALHFLPKDLPFSTQVPAGNKAIQPDDYINEWRKRNRQTVKELSHRSFEWLYGQDDARDATAFEMLCDDAVARARCLWAAVIGKKRASRVDPSDEEQESNERSYEQKRLNDEINGLWHTHNKEINGEHCLSLSLALRLIIPRSNDKLRGRYFSEWAKHVANEVVHVDWEEQKEVYDTLPYIQYNDDGGKLVSFKVVRHLNKSDFVKMYCEFRPFYESNRFKVLRKIAGESGSKGGTATQAKNKRRQQAAIQREKTKRERAAKMRSSASR